MSYVPAAAIVCRTAAVRAVGGFDEALRWGEDVDLVWRLTAAGWRCRYEPSVVVVHRARAGIGGWLRQQFEYGTSAAPLARRHPGALAPLRVSAWTAATWLLVAARRPLAAVLLAAATAVALQRKLRGVPPAESAELVARGTLGAGEQIATGVTRAWWPVVVPLALWRPARLPVLAAFVCRGALGSVAIAIHSPGALRRHAARRRHGLRRRRLARRVRERSLDALRPDLSNWPPRPR